MEQKTHMGLAELEKRLKDYGFVKDTELMNVGKGDDYNGAFIIYRQSENKYILSVSINGKTIINKEYKLSPPNYFVPVDLIIKDLGQYKTYNFKKTGHIG
jgi:hypothetical protein